MPPRSRRARLAVLLALLAASLGALFAVRARRRRVTFADVAPVVYRRCAPCHRPGESGPFSLLSYDDVARRRRQILRVITAGVMPPWKPVAGYGHFRNDRSLSRDERALLERWVAAGAPEGDRRDVPAPPQWPSGWRLGTPDVVLTMPASFDFHADGDDVYRNFVIPSGIRGARYVAAWEFRPGSRAVHHAIVNLDRRGWARRRDAADPLPGYAGMEGGNLQSPDGFYLVWAPGNSPTPPDPSMAWRIDERTDLVLQLHLHATGRAESVRSTIGLYFASAAPTRPRVTLRIGDRPIDIPPGDAAWTMRDGVTLPVDVFAVGLFPHAHYLARRMRVWATLPDGRVEQLLRIDDWDPAWQDAYAFAQPVALPRGSALSMEYVYDNSEANERNPNTPPRRVTTGEGSFDEMGNVTFDLLPRDPHDLDALQEAKYRRLLASSPFAEFNLANVLQRRGHPDEAIAHYRNAVARMPDLDAAWFNLGNALSARGDQAGAIEAYRAAIRIRPDQAGANVNLGNALLALGRVSEAVDALRAAVRVDPRMAVAHNALGQALARSGDFAGAVTAFRAAEAIEPDNAASYFELGNALRALGSLAEARAAWERALSIAPGFGPARAALDALDHPSDAGVR